MCHHIFHQIAGVATILALLPGLAHAEPVGRLFFTPEQRAAFDAQRSGGGAVLPAEGSSAAAQGSEVTLNGIVKRSDGKTTIWVNQSVQSEAEAASAAKTRARHAHLPNVPVFVPALGKTVILKVGQTLDTDSREIRESYQPSPPKEPATPPVAAASSPSA